MFYGFWSHAAEEKQLEQSLERAGEAKETELLVREHPVALMLKCKVSVVVLNAE